MIDFKMLDSRYTEEALGFIPLFIFDSDSRPAAEQFNDRYAHGGGWSPMRGWSMGPVGEIMYPGDPALHPIAVATHGTETIRIYPHAWVSIAQGDGSFEVSRMD